MFKIDICLFLDRTIIIDTGIEHLKVTPGVTDQRPDIITVKSSATMLTRKLNTYSTHRLNTFVYS